MSKIRVLIVDDSFFMRKLLVELFKDEAEIEIIGEARNGLEAIRLSKELKPDVITMDFNMPGMNGAEATEAILSGVKPLPAIIMLSAATKKGAEEALKSMHVGAVDFISKPSGELSLDIEKIKAELIFKVKLLSKANVAPSRLVRILPVKKADKIAKEEAIKIIVIGSSTGGPPAVEYIMSAIPADLKVAILVVQHMPEKFTKSFAERLDRVTVFHTKEAEAGEPIRNGVCLIAPGNYHMEVVKKDNALKAIRLNQDQPQHGLRPAIDVTMKTAAANYPGGIVGIILTGMGHDGTEGMKAIKEMGGHTIVQSPETAVIDSMPTSVIEAGIADEVIPLDGIAQRIIELSRK